MTGLPTLAQLAPLSLLIWNCTPAMPEGPSEAVAVRVGLLLFVYELAAGPVMLTCGAVWSIWKLTVWAASMLPATSTL